MRIQHGPLWFDLPSDLVDEALILASQSAPESLRDQFLTEREAVSTIEIVDIREESFRRLDEEWVDRLGVADALRDIMREKGATNGSIRECVAKCVRADVEEKARIEADVLYLAVRAETLLSPDRLREILAGIL